MGVAAAVVFVYMLLWVAAVMLVYIAFAHRQGRSRARWLAGSAIYAIGLLFAPVLLAILAVESAAVSSSGGAGAIISTPRP